jgi:polyhydroxyalkanoate synthesis repressor PhaR
VSTPTPPRHALRRYGNRKIYEPAQRRYVTLEQIAGLLAEGHDVEVADQRSGEDITNVVLAQVLFERVKDRSAAIPRSVLVRLVRLAQSAPAWPDWATPQQAAHRTREEAERIAAGLLSRGRLTIEEALALRHEIAHSAQRLLTDAQRGLEARLHGLLDREGEPIPFQALRERLLSLATEPEAPTGPASDAPRGRRRGGRKPAPAPSTRRPARRP